MQQIKCASCEFTKFFVNTIEGTSLISCCECGASFIVGTPDSIQVQKKQVLKEKFKVQEPEETIEPQIEEPIEEKVPEPKAVARRMTPEEKKAMVTEMEKGDE